MTTLVCNHKGCKYEATHERPGYAAAMLGRHKKFKHGIAGKYSPSRNKAPQEVAAPTNPVAPPPPPQTPNYCPQCGCHLRAVTAALNLGRKG